MTYPDRFLAKLNGSLYLKTNSKTMSLEDLKGNKQKRTQLSNVSSST